MMKRFPELGPGDEEWEGLADRTLDIYISPKAAEERAAALRIWEDLTLLELAIAPGWVIAIWLATGAIKAEETEPAEGLPRDETDPNVG